jgi:hypothetical protein
MDSAQVRARPIGCWSIRVRGDGQPRCRFVVGTGGLWPGVTVGCVRADGWEEINCDGDLGIRTLRNASVLVRFFDYSDPLLAVLYRPGAQGGLLPHQIVKTRQERSEDGRPALGDGHHVAVA